MNNTSPLIALICTDSRLNSRFMRATKNELYKTVHELFNYPMGRFAVQE